MRVRLNAKGGDAEAKSLSVKLGGRETNVSFYLLGPGGEKVHFKKGDRSMGQFLRESGGVSGIVARMEEVARLHPGKAASAEPIPRMRSLAEALVQAHCDAEPILLVTEGSVEADGLVKRVGSPDVLARFRTAFYFVKLPKDSPEISKFKVPRAPSLLFLRPSRLGTEAVVMETRVSPEDLAGSLEEALGEFGRTFQKLSRDGTLEKGKKEGIRYQP